MSASVFPARAGMSPRRVLDLRSAPRVPRASGDEPVCQEGIFALESCSPRERG